MNEEISALKKIIGLEVGKTYTSFDDLRYAKILVIADQDVDGAHVKGLIFNVFQSMWPSLFKIPGFLQSMRTPIVKVTRGDSPPIEFFNLNEYSLWKEATGALQHLYKVKYLKGLGTSSSAESKQYFKAMNIVVYEHTGAECDECIDLAFNKKRADDRKDWLAHYDPAKNTVESRMSFVDFIDKELSHFSHYDVERSIPSVIDGLKPSQRKIMFGMFKRCAGEVKVEQLGGYVSEHSAYHHGEASLHGAIVGLAQNFVGSNNLELLTPIGQFGSRIQGGKDSASPRYIFCDLNPVTRKLFRKEDESVLKYLDDDGQRVEPEWYCPIIPLALVNGANGIGTGFSTQLPNFKVADVISNVRATILGEPMAAMTPHYRGFTGTVYEDSGKFYTKGIFSKLSQDSVEVTELPVGTWTEDYKHFLEDALDNPEKVLKDYVSQYTDTHVKFVLHFYPGKFSAETFEKDFKLVGRPLGVTNVHFMDARGKIKKYNDLNEIVTDFCETRRTVYESRKACNVAELERDLSIARSRVFFIEDVLSGAILIGSFKKSDLVLHLSDDPRMYRDGDSDGYEYLVKMPMYNLTVDKADQLRANICALTERLAALNATSVETMWLNELDELEDAYVDDLVQTTKKRKKSDI
jgi:DNA topoisomerase-2